MEILTPAGSTRAEAGNTCRVPVGFESKIRCKSWNSWHTAKPSHFWLKRFCMNVAWQTRKSGRRRCPVEKMMLEVIHTKRLPVPKSPANDMWTPFYCPRFNLGTSLL